MQNPYRALSSQKATAAAAATLKRIDPVSHRNTHCIIGIFNSRIGKSIALGTHNYSEPRLLSQRRVFKR